MSDPIPFTQYLRPDGRQRPMTIVRPGPITEKAEAIIAAGYRFEIEELMHGKISMTIFDPVDEEDVAIEVCANGPPVLEHVDKMILGFEVVSPGRHTREGAP